MNFEFGPFQLDGPGRALRLMGREVPLQPRVFDLLVYLVHNRARVVSKDELLDALWPGVTVTEGALQRAVSTLRAALREGGMEEAIRSFPRIGYRFSQLPEMERGLAAADREPASLAAARQAVAEQRWNDAAKLYTAIDAGETLEGADLDGWALAEQCRGKPVDAVPSSPGLSPSIWETATAMPPQRVQWRSASSISNGAMSPSPGAGSPALRIC